MKLLVETTGPFMVYLPAVEQIVEADRPGVVTPSAFMNIASTDGRLRVLHQLADTASDAEFLETLQDSKGDKKLAVEAYASMHPYDDVAATPKPKTQPQGKGGKAA